MATRGHAGGLWCPGRAVWQKSNRTSDPPNAVTQKLLQQEPGDAGLRRSGPHTAPLSLPARPSLVSWRCSWISVPEAGWEGVEGTVVAGKAASRGPPDPAPHSIVLKARFLLCGSYRLHLYKRPEAWALLSLSAGLQEVCRNSGHKGWGYQRPQSEHQGGPCCPA